MRGIGPADSAQKRGKSAKICEFSGKFIHSFSRNLVLQWSLMGRPQQGDLIRGSGGIRKMRWKLRGQGKQGGLRVIYYWADSRGYIYMINIYAKNE
jgi:hypothetical protein